MAGTRRGRLEWPPARRHRELRRGRNPSSTARSARRPARSAEHHGRKRRGRRRGGRWRRRRPPSSPLAPRSTTSSTTVDLRRQSLPTTLGGDVATDRNRSECAACRLRQTWRGGGRPGSCRRRQDPMGRDGWPVRAQPDVRAGRDRRGAQVQFAALRSTLDGADPRCDGCRLRPRRLPTTDRPRRGVHPSTSNPCQHRLTRRDRRRRPEPGYPGSRRRPRSRSGRHGAGDDGQSRFRWSAIHRHDGTEDHRGRGDDPSRGALPTRSMSKSTEGSARTPSLSAVAAGANVLVAGSALYRDPLGLEHAVSDLRARATAAHA